VYRQPSAEADYPVLAAQAFENLAFHRAIDIVAEPDPVFGLVQHQQAAVELELTQAVENVSRQLVERVRALALMQKAHHHAELVGGAQVIHQGFDGLVGNFL
jgi:copper homeostasis protein CutC